MDAIVSNEPARGFSLIEIAVVIAIAMMLLTLGLGLMNAQISSAAASVTKKRQEAIKDALIAYLGTNKKLPCPQMPVSGTNVTGQAPAQSGTPPACPAVGVVPFATLGLGREIAEDGWGNFFSYRVYADSAPNCPAGWDWGNSACFGEGKDGINPFKMAMQINDGTIASPTLVAGNAIAVVVSHGPNGLGAWVAQGTRNTAPTTCEELHNTVNLTGCVLAANTFYKGERQDNDDIVAYLKASEALQTLMKQGTIKSPTAKVNEDLQTLVDTAISVKRSLVGVSWSGNATGCSNTVETDPAMTAAISSIRDPWGASYLVDDDGGGFPICIYSSGGAGAACPSPSTTCAPSAASYLCRSLAKTSFNAYLTKVGDPSCP